MLPYVNIHTHRPTGSGIELRTAGVHPWDADMQEVAALGERLSDAQAVGETGLDFVHGPSRAVIFHGFIGSPEQARQALAKGYLLSFGERAFASPKTLAALRETPLSQLFLETDDSPVPIAAVYARAAEARGIPVEELQRATLANYERIFETQHG